MSECDKITSMTTSTLSGTSTTFSPIYVSNNILKRAFDEGVSMNAMKLQKILYFVASDYAKANGGQPLFNEQFRAWGYGPVMQTVYDQFASLEGAIIQVYTKNAKGKGSLNRESSHPKLTNALDPVWLETKGVPAVHLARITCLPDSGWAKVFKADQNNVISDAFVAQDDSYVSLLNLKH